MSKQARARNRKVFLRVENLEKRENPAPIVPVYNSNPTAFAQLFLDFDGNTEPSGWCGTSGAITTTVFSSDADFNNFSASELSVIDAIWKRMAEDFAPFKLNVTTVLPSDFNNKHAVRLAIGDQSGGGISWGSIGGVACLGSFYNTASNVVYIVPDGLGPNNAKYMAMAGSHEAGHSFGLPHQPGPAPTCASYHSGGTFNGESKGPIMGAPYNSTREIFWLGFEGCGTTNDNNTLSNANNGFGYVADDISAVPSEARRLRNNGGVLAGNLTGVIHQITDADWFFFGGPAGNATITLSAAAVGPNFDGILELYQDVAGVPVLLATADPSGNVFGATINFSVPAGKKYIVVKSDGDYGEVGAYSLSGSVPSTGLLPGIGKDTHPMASLFDSVDTSADENLPAPRPSLDLENDLFTVDERAAIATVARKQTTLTLPLSQATSITAGDLLSPAIAADVTVDAKSTSSAAVTHRMLTGAPASDMFGDASTDPLVSSL